MRKFGCYCCCCMLGTKCQNLDLSSFQDGFAVPEEEQEGGLPPAEEYWFQEAFSLTLSPLPTHLERLIDSLKLIKSSITRNVGEWCSYPPFFCQISRRGSKDWWHNSHLIVIEKQPALTAENLCQLLLPRVNYYSILNLLCTLLLCYFYYDIDLYEDSSPKPLYIYFTTQHKGQYTNKNIDCCISNAG